MGVRAPATNQIPDAGAAAFRGGLMAGERVSRRRRNVQAGPAGRRAAKRVELSCRMAPPAWNADLRSAQPAAGGRNGVTPIREE